MSELRCWNCGEALTGVPRPISRHEQCPACFEALHCCRLCRHYRREITPQCDEDRADPPVVKENANFCDWFRPSSAAFAGSRPTRQAAARGQLDALFGGGSDPQDDPENTAPGGEEKPPTPEEEARSRLDDLFSRD